MDGAHIITSAWSASWSDFAGSSWMPVVRLIRVNTWRHPPRISMMGVTRVGIRDAYYVAIRENTNVAAASCSSLVHVPFNDIIDGSQRANCQFLIIWSKIIQNYSKLIRTKNKREFSIDDFFANSAKHTCNCWPTELMHNSNYTDISDHRFDFDSIFNYHKFVVRAT